MSLKNKIFQIFKNESIKFAAIGSLGIKFISAILVLSTSILLARSMSLENYGYYILALSIITVLTIPVTMGLPNMLVKYISKYKVNNQYKEIKGLLIRSNQLVLLSYLIVSFLAIVLYFTWWNYYNDNLTSTIWIGFIVLLFMSLGGIRGAILRGLKMVILGQLPEMLIRNLLLFIGVFYFYFNNLKLSPQNVMILHAFSACIAYFAGHIFLYKKLIKNIKGITPVFYNKEWIKETIPFTINGGVQIIRTKLITFVLATFGSIESIAIYDIALRGATLVSFTLNALNTAIAPYIASAFEKNNLKNLQSIVARTSKIIFLSTIPIVLIFLFGGTTLISILFGEEYIMAYIPLVIMCVGELISSMTGPVGLVLSMTGNQAYFARNNIYISLLNILICIPFVMLWNVTGAAIVFSLLLISQNIVLYLHTKKKLNINTTIFQ